jgi:hypothetical protein
MICYNRLLFELARVPGDQGDLSQFPFGEVTEQSLWRGEEPLKGEKSSSNIIEVSSNSTLTDLRPDFARGALSHSCPSQPTCGACVAFII